MTLNYIVQFLVAVVILSMVYRTVLAGIAIANAKDDHEARRDVLGKTQSLRLILYRVWLIQSLVSVLWSRATKQDTDVVQRLDDQRPPRLATYLLYFLPMPKKQREDMLGDLEEVYHDRCLNLGSRHAKLWYCTQVVMSFWPIINGWFWKLLGAMRRLIS